MTDGAREPVELYRAESLPEAHAIRLALESEGIVAHIDNELLQGALGDLPMGWSTAPRILVDRSDEPAARAILEAVRQGVAARSETPPVADLSTEDAGPNPAASGIGESKPVLLTRHEIAWEVVAVLAVGVVPYFVNAVVYLGFPVLQQSYWRDALYSTLTSACTIFVTLYLIRRSGEPWERFGISRPRFVDLMIAPALVVVIRSLWLPLSGLVSNADFSDDPVELFRTPWDGALDILRYAIGGFSAELVTRAYLITRLETLLRSRTRAVLFAAVAFSSYHAAQGLSGVVYSLIFGVVFGAAYLILRRVWPLALAHLLHNIWIDLR
jgi:membrane protease YdiL (CAAX protease family)